MQRLKKGKYGNADDDLVTEEKDNPLEVPNDELEAQFNACVMRHRIDKIKKGRKDMDSDDNDSGVIEESNDENCESTKGQTQEKRKRGRPPKKKRKTKQCH